MGKRGEHPSFSLYFGAFSGFSAGFGGKPHRLTKDRAGGIVVLRCNNSVINVTVDAITGGTHEIYTGEGRNLRTDGVGDDFWFGGTHQCSRCIP